MFDNPASGKYGARHGLFLHARRDIHRLAEIILAVVQRHGEARTFMDADLDYQIVPGVARIEARQFRPYAQGGGQGAVGRRKRRHHRIADCLDHRACLACDNVLQQGKMRAHQVEGSKITHALVEFGRPFQIGENKRQAGDFQALVDIHGLCAVEIAERLVDEQTLGGQERAALTQQVMQGVTGNPHGGKHARVRIVLKIKPQRSRCHHDSAGRRMHLVENHRQFLPVARRLAFDIDELHGMGDRLEHDEELRRQVQRQARLVARREFERIERDLLQHRFKVGRLQVNAGTPENLAEIFKERQRLGVMGGDTAHARRDGKRHFDPFIERGFETCGAERAIIVCLANAFQGHAAVEHAPATRTQHIPRHVEQANARGAHEARDRFGFQHAIADGKSQNVDPVEIAVAACVNQMLDGSRQFVIDRLPQDIEEG